MGYLRTKYSFVMVCGEEWGFRGELPKSKNALNQGIRRHFYGFIRVWWCLGGGGVGEWGLFGRV